MKLSVSNTTMSITCAMLSQNAVVHVHIIVVLKNRMRKYSLLKNTIAEASAGKKCLYKYNKAAINCMLAQSFTFWTGCTG